MENCPEGAIDGLFSVSENKYVYFSKGNLQYNIRKKKWQFAESQWDYIGKKNEKKLDRLRNFTNFAAPFTEKNLFFLFSPII